TQAGCLDNRAENFRTNVWNGWTYYRAEVDDCQRAFRSPDGRVWLVQTKSAVWLNFGLPVDDPTDVSGLETHAGGKIFRWGLVRQFDVTGNNEVVYRYAALGPNDGEQPTATSVDGLRYLTDIY